MFFKSVLSPKLETSTLTEPAPWFTKMFGVESSSGETVTVGSALTVPTVYACVNILANSVAKLPFQTFKKTSTGRERDKNHAVTKVLEKRPNPYQSPFKFKHTIETHRNTWGNAYINIINDAAGRPKELWLLNPALTEPIVDVHTNEIWYFTTLPDGTSTKIGYNDVVHLTSLATDGLKGKPPIQVAREAIGSSQAAQKFKGKFYKNGATNSGFLKIPGMLNPDAKKVVREEWESANTGLNNAQRIAILDAGLEFQNTSMPLKDAQFVEGMKYDKTEIATLYNIPLHMVNELERSTNSNIEQQSLDFIQNTLSPIIKQWEEEFSYQLFTEREQKRYYLKFNLTSLLRADSKSRGEYYQMMIQMGAMSINEVRSLEELDDINLGDKHYMSLNYTTLELLEDYQKAKAGTPAEGGEGD